MRKQVLIAIAALAAVALVVWLVASRAPSEGPRGLPVRTAAERARELPRDVAAERLRTLQVESASLMPDDARGVYLGLSRTELLRLRPRAQQGRGAPPGQVLYQEVLANGAVAAYLVATSIDRVAQVQFLSRLADPSRVGDHLRAVRGRYGDPTGLFDCPREGDTAPTRRILWVGREVTVMEAVLAHPGGVSLTLALAGNADVMGNMRRNGCRPVTRQSLEDWPVATELRGERVPVQR